MPITKTEKEKLRTEYSKVWKDQKMIDYCVNKVAEYAVLSNENIVTVDKQTIEKDFCFGESGYDYDDAQAMAAHARKSEKYFKDKNMEYFKEWIDDLTNCVNVTNNGRYVLVIAPKAYYSQTEDCKLASITWCKLTDIIDSMGGSCYVEDLPGTEITVHGTLYRIATKEEVYQIYEMYRRAEKNHEKKVDSYLKRYGTSKVNSWTYWRDA